MFKDILKPETIVWLIIAIIYLISKLGLGISYLSVYDIIKNHIDCFRSTTTHKIMIVPIIDYCIMPFVLGASAVIILS